MAKLTKRTTKQLRSSLGFLSADELVEMLLSHAARDDDLRDRLLIDAAKRGATAVDLKSFQRSIDAAVFDLAESRYGSQYTSGGWGTASTRAPGGSVSCWMPAKRRRATSSYGCLRLSAPCAGHHLGVVEVGENPGRAFEIGDRDRGTTSRLGGECPPQVLVAGEAEALGIGVDGDDHVLGQVADEDVREGNHLLGPRVAPHLSGPQAENAPREPTPRPHRGSHRLAVELRS